jgi:hypothetical protein
MFENMLSLEFFKFGNLWFGKRERENYEGICPAFISLSSEMGSTDIFLWCARDETGARSSWIFQKVHADECVQL